MALSPAQFAAIAQTVGTVGVLAIVVLAFFKDWVMTITTVQKLIDAATHGKDAEIAELTRQRDQLWDLVQRNAGSQQAQAEAFKETTSAIIDALAAHNRALGAPPP